jgi:hypothetical protein
VFRAGKIDNVTIELKEKTAATADAAEDARVRASLQQALSD